MEIYLVFGRKSNGLADGDAYASKEAALLSIKRHGGSEDDYKLVRMNVVTSELVNRWIEQDKGAQ